MGALIPRLIVIGLGASVSPVAIMVLITVLTRKHARRNSLLFLAAFTLTLIALGVAGVYLLHLGGSGEKEKIDAYIDLALGIICLLAIPLSIRKKTRKEQPEVETDLKPSRAFILGGVTMLVNTSTLVIFVAGLHAITAAKLEAMDDFLALLVLTAATLITLLVPMALYFAFPKSAERLLSRLGAWLSKHKKLIATAILLAFGVYLSVKGVMGIL
jgi:hypothetical protein